MPALAVAVLLAARAETDAMDPGWPNVLVALFVIVVVGGLTASVVVYRRARASIRDPRRQRQ